MLIMNLKMKDLKTAYIAYKLRDKNGVIQYIGTCRLNRISQLPDAVRNPLFIHLFNLNEPITVESIFISNSREECHSKRIEAINAMPVRPTMNMGEYKGQHGVPIICNETGQVFKTLQEVVDTHGCTLAALSKHLRGKKGCHTVRGNTYQRGPLRVDMDIFNNNAN